MSEVPSSAAALPVPRLFFALWPTEAVRAAIETATSAMVLERGARRVPLDSLHLTLAFLGAVPVERVPGIRSVGGRTRGSAFELTLDRLGTFHRSGVLCLAATQVPAALLALAATLRQALREVGCAVDARPFVPHLTLARRVTHVPGIKVLPLRWTVQSFALVESRLTPRGAYYRIIEQWRLEVP